MEPIMTVEEITKLQAEFAAINAKMKAAKKAGLIVKAVAPAKQKPAETLLLIECFKPIVEGNVDLISKFFEAGVDGQDSVSFPVNTQYTVIIRDMTVTKAKGKDRKDKAEAAALKAKEIAELDALNAIEAENLDEKQTARLIELSEKYPKVVEEKPAE